MFLIEIALDMFITDRIPFVLNRSSRTWIITLGRIRLGILALNFSGQSVRYDFRNIDVDINCYLNCAFFPLNVVSLLTWKICPD